MTIKVGINGMGRIGRMVIRAIIESQNKNIEIKHINNRSNSEASCSLIKYDSIHGKFNADLDYDEKHLIINNNTKSKIKARSGENKKKYNTNENFDDNNPNENLQLNDKIKIKKLYYIHTIPYEITP